VELGFGSELSMHLGEDQIIVLHSTFLMIMISGSPDLRLTAEPRTRQGWP